MKAYDLVTRCVRATESAADPMGSVRALLEDLRGDIAEIERALHYVSGIGATHVKFLIARPTSPC